MRSSGFPVKMSVATVRLRGWPVVSGQGTDPRLGKVRVARRAEAGPQRFGDADFGGKIERSLYPGRYRRVGSRGARRESLELLGDHRERVVVADHDRPALVLAPQPLPDLQRIGAASLDAGEGQHVQCLLRCAECRG